VNVGADTWNHLQKTGPHPGFDLCECFAGAGPVLLG